MTKIWGPLGWMTLHSVSLIYPENPSQYDKQIATRFLDLFGETISCIQCKSHFRNIFNIYKSSNPEFLNSRQDFALFGFRAHNTVNLRLDKPRPSSVSECLRTLKAATAQTSFASFRQAYLSYLLKNWGHDISGQGLVTKEQVKDMIKINNEYWSPREIPIPDLKEGDIITPIELSKSRVNSRGTVVSNFVGFKGGKLMLTKR
uniref:thiol oxidase n=1 Tax=viral metagenome TaxID=1070528 RepID=A0A6C0B166_9ZZZZ